MKQHTSEILFAYWDTVRAGRIAPRRFEIEPARLSPILSETLILERVDSASWRFRLAGTRVCEQLGLELRGLNILDVWGGEDGTPLAAALAALAAEGAACAIEVEGASADGRKRARFEMLLLPLQHSGNSLDRCLGCLSAIEPPPWLGSVRLPQRRVVSVERLGQQGVDIEAAAPSPFRADVRAARIVRADRRQFRVYDGGLSAQPPGPRGR